MPKRKKRKMAEYQIPEGVDREFILDQQRKSRIAHQAQQEEFAKGNSFRPVKQDDGLDTLRMKTSLIPAIDYQIPEGIDREFILQQQHKNRMKAREAELELINGPCPRYSGPEAPPPYVP